MTLCKLLLNLLRAPEPPTRPVRAASISFYGEWAKQERAAGGESGARSRPGA